MQMCLDLTDEKSCTSHVSAFLRRVSSVPSETQSDTKGIGYIEMETFERIREVSCVTSLSVKIV